MNRHHPLALLCVLLAMALCATSARAITLTQLQNNISSIINNSNSSVQWSVLIENQWGNQTYYSLNPATMRRPASNTKIFTTAAAFRIRGTGYVWNGYSLGSSSTASPVHSILSDSNNSLADSLFSNIGGQSAALNSLGGITNMSGARMDDGSGLDYDNRFNCRQTIDVIRWCVNNYTYGQWASHLAISCTDGTLGSRLCGSSTSGRVHAKTGTLTNGGTLSLSGYIDNVNDGQRYYFSIYTNSVPSASQTDTRNRIDQIVAQMAQAAIPNPGAPNTGVIVDNTDPGCTIPSSSWFPGTSIAGYYGTNYHARATEAISDQVTWSANLPTSGSYKVYARWTTGSNRSTTAPFTVVHTGGNSLVSVNQQLNNGTWVLLGTYDMAAGNAVRVKLSCWTVSGYFVIADAVRFEKQ